MNPAPGPSQVGRLRGPLDPDLDERGFVPFTEVQRAASAFSGEIVRTPLLPSPSLSELTGRTVRLKLESLQRGGSFKLRGALTYVSRIPDSEAERGIITYSSGNHGQAVALAARLRSLPAVIVMPTTVSPLKRKGAERLGAKVVLAGTTSLERRARAEAISASEGFHIVPPFDHPVIIAGQGTCALEAIEDWPELDTWIVPIGGGGLAAGSAVSLRALRPGARIIGVEPKGAAAMRRSLEAGAPVTLDRVDTIADGLAPVRPGELTFRHVAELFDEVVAVPDGAIREATRFLLHTQKLVVEYSGAASVAALRAGLISKSGRGIGCVVSGGNLDPAILRELL